MALYLVLHFDSLCKQLHTTEQSDLKAESLSFPRVQLENGTSLHLKGS